jgi:hypothetical protein
MNKVVEYKEHLLDKYRSRIREKAILQAKSRIALAGRQVRDFAQDQLEIIVFEEEEKIKSKLRQSGLIAILITLGLS